MVKSLTFSLTTSLVLSAASSILAQNTTSTSTSSTPSSPPAQVSPAYLSNVVPLPGNVESYPTGGNGSVPTGPLATVSFNTSGYPTPWKKAPTTGAEVQAAIAAINWNVVPNAAVRKANANGDLSFSGYDSNTDPDCWWSASGCIKSKNPSIPPDVAACPEVGDWGLTYDDGPLTSDAGSWAEPNLYDFLATHNQKAGLFYIGSNVIAAPAAAQRALADGHTLCVHTWSHNPSTSLTNEEFVAEIYYTLKAIKEVTGVTPKCWRPPYGDVDDRIRSIAWQMGLTTVIWDEDTNDWNMPGDGGGNLSPETVDGYFEGWIAARKNGTDNKTGHIILQHELNNATVSMAEKWLPQVKEAFNVVPWNQCFNVSQPYWETKFVYPTSNGSTPAIVSSSSAIPSATSSPSPSSSPISSGAVVGAAQTSSGSHTFVSSSTSVLLGVIATVFYYIA